MEIGAEGFTLSWTDGAAYFQAWSNLHTTLVIMDFSHAGYQARMQYSRNRWVALSGEAAQALASEASKQRLAVSVKKIVASNGAAGVQTVISPVNS